MAEAWRCPYFISPQSTPTKTMHADTKPVHVTQTQKTISVEDHLEPWKDDGNIVLTVQGKYFRVHRSILSTYSEVFKCLFTCSHPDQAEEEFFEKCLIVHLYDAVTDVEVMLKALYDRSYPVPSYKGTLPLPIVAIFFRLGEKYVIPVLVDEAKAKLSCSIKPTLSVANAPFDFKVFPGITASDPYNFQVMNLLQEIDLKGPLVLAMYQCTITCPLTAIVDGYQFNGSICSLSSANMGSFICIKDMLENLRIDLVKHTSRSRRRNCNCNMHQLLMEDLNHALPPFSPWEPEWDEVFCHGCKGNLEAERQKMMNDTWDRLPTLFGFSSWEDVKNKSSPG